ncbi:hypothetical protein GGR53DRAFT_178742 [Hypoxylon sp. FL1150]|nr:hypothetical protein GGR53DRAFT_178742 [Hypoxylon sp. FL1150]
MKVVTIWLVLACIVAQIVAFDLFRSRITSHVSISDIDSSIPNGTISSKYLSDQCDSDSWELVQSNERHRVYYLRGVCRWPWTDIHEKRCSYLDLNMCYINDGGNIRYQKFGRFLDTCTGCTLRSKDGSHTLLTCTCGRGKDNGGGTQESTIELNDDLYIKNGFLSCFGYTNFECPSNNVPY